MKIGLISDTHVPRDAKRLPPQIASAFRGVSLIIHAGDIYVSEVLDELQKIAPVVAARGNGDTGLTDEPRVKECILMEVEGRVLGAVHGIDYPEPVWTTIDKQILREFKRPVDILVFGDTHVAVIDTYKNTLLINPGSPTVPNGLYDLGTVGLLDITRESITPRIVNLKELPVETV